MQALDKNNYTLVPPPYCRKRIFFLYNKIFSNVKPFAVCSYFRRTARGFLFSSGIFIHFGKILHIVRIPFVRRMNGI